MPLPIYYKAIYTDWKKGMGYADLMKKYELSRGGIVNALYKYKLKHGLMLEIGGSLIKCGSVD